MCLHDVPTVASTDPTDLLAAICPSPQPYFPLCSLQSRAWCRALWDWSAARPTARQRRPPVPLPSESSLVLCRLGWAACLAPVSAATAGAAIRSAPALPPPALRSIPSTTQWTYFAFFFGGGGLLLLPYRRGIRGGLRCAAAAPALHLCWRRAGAMLAPATHPGAHPAACVIAAKQACCFWRWPSSSSCP